MVVNITLEDNVTAPLYVWSPVVVTFAPRLEVPDIDTVVSPVIAPSRSKSPVTVNAFVPPTVDPKLIIDPVKFLAPPDKVTPLV